MTALAADFALTARGEIAAPSLHARRQPSEAVATEEDCNRHLWLHITLLAPLSAALWAGMGWSGYQLVSWLAG